MSLLDDLTAAHQPPLPKGFKPGIVYSGRSPQEIITPWMREDLTGAEPAAWEDAVARLGIPLPPGKTLELVEARFNSASWHRDAAFISQKDTAYTAPAWVYKFRVVDKGLRDDEDLAALMVEAKKSRRQTAVKTTTGVNTKIVNLADFQVGKTDERGGTAELLDRSENALMEVCAMIRKGAYDEIVLVDVGDSTENFESSPNADRTNDLQMTQQIRVWRRIFWRWLDALSAYGIPMKVVAVPSNHCRVRRGKQALGPSDDDWGLEVLTQISDIAAANPEKYGHVSFHAPRKYENHVTLTLVGGKVQTFLHGHDAGTADQLPRIIKAQGRREIGVSDIVTAGHFHHLRVVAFGDDQTLFVCPTMDPGSSHYTVYSGERSRPGVLTYDVTDEGWCGLRVVWAA